jgi:Spy/CpxP family protein refolding chaperone
MKIVHKLLLAGLLVSFAGFAQIPGGGGGGGGEESGGMGGGGGRGVRGGGIDAPSVGFASKSRLELLSDLLKLNKDQKKEIKATMDEGQKEAAPLREQMSKSHEQIAEAIAAGKGQEEINAAVKAYAELEAQMVTIELKAFAKIYSGLDSEQKQKSAPLFQMMSGIFKGKNWNET